MQYASKISSLDLSRQNLKITCDAPLRREAPEIGDGLGVTMGVVGSDTLTSISVGWDSRLIVFDGGGVETSVSSSHGPISSIVMSSCDWGDSVLIVTCWAKGASLTAILSFTVDGDTRWLLFILIFCRLRLRFFLAG